MTQGKFDCHCTSEVMASQRASVAHSPSLAMELPPYSQVAALSEAVLPSVLSLSIHLVLPALADSPTSGSLSVALVALLEASSSSSCPVHQATVVAVVSIASVCVLTNLFVLLF
jgi:hypothetical protein